MPAYILTASVNVYVPNAAGLATFEVDEQASPDYVSTSFAAKDDAEARAIAERVMHGWLGDFGSGDVYDPRLVRHPGSRTVEMRAEIAELRAAMRAAVAEDRR